jgi:arylsulfatase A-like enzyme
MPRSLFADLTVAGWFLIASLAIAPCGLAANSKPNVVIFLADDAGWGDYHCNGNQQVATPNIDSIARDGVSLDRFYVCPVCSPTRAEFLTGRYHPRTGVTGVSTGQERLNLDETTIAEIFQSSGYATGAFGKWHNGSQWPYHPMARGFDEFYGYTSGHWGEYFDPPLEHNGAPVRAKGYIVDACTDQAIDFIERNQKKPFLCYVPFTTPHSPWAVPESNWIKFKDKPITQRGNVANQEDLDQTRCALAMIENQDQNVGRVLAKLSELKLDDSTIVIYFSDNGPNTFRWNGGLKGKKGTTDEGGVRSACFIRWPARIAPASKHRELMGAIDLLPTLTGLAGISFPSQKPLDGIDQSPQILGEHASSTRRTLFSHWAGQVAMRSGDHLLDHTGKLFDLRNDPGQKSPVNQEQAALRDQMQREVIAWRKEMNLHKTPKQGGNDSVDERPISVGYKVFPRTWLPARDAEATGEIRRSAAAPNSSYFVNWKSTTDRITWNLQVETEGVYDVQMLYTCRPGDVGAKIRFACGNASLERIVNEAWDPPLYKNQDTIPRPLGESKMKEFKTLDVGTIRLARGNSPLLLNAVDVPGEQVIDLRAVVLTLRR